ncbi:hypothetical protein K435DRAFT_775164 [Dendrothele bispora CBS 962.96]|uniref:Aprataxin and PNK-like factor PBZ domain-containing protein n=1 Tax=Dendrothele bispora (strain CBS 962.96) TaxID=1314807 RepID=A0A4S8MJQ4_DENBC|nr:hypothetical protein K435DRAFT_775164 [Dendrothele bispora CBS 962.96]
MTSNGLPLNDDIVDRILTFLPSFSALRSAILTSKSFYEVFQTRPKSTIRAVSFNVVGPALPQALRMVRYNPPDYDSEEMIYDDLPQPELEDVHEAPITPKESVELIKIEETVRGLEDLFSLRHKNRRLTASQLPPLESHRFCRAVYRIMLYSRIFEWKRYPDLVERMEFEGTDSGEIAVVMEKTRAARTEFLSQFSTRELYEILCVTVFLEEILKVAIKDLDEAQGRDNLESLLAIGPAAILQEFRDPGYDDGSIAELIYAVDDNESYPFSAGFLSNPIGSLLAERGVKIPSRDDRELWSSILDIIDGEHDTCDQCGRETGLELLGPSTYGYFDKSSEILNATSIHNLLKGKLPRNHREHGRYLSEARWSDGEPAFTAAFRWIHQGHKLAEFDGWKEEDWLCECCMVGILREHLHLWLLDLKVQNGEKILENCWWGYNCRTQTHSSHHASRLNHLCEQTRFA